MKSKHLALILAFTALLSIGPAPAHAQHAGGPHRGPVHGRGYAPYRPRSHGYGYGYGYGYGPRYIAPRGYSYSYGGGPYGRSWSYGYSSGYGSNYGSSFYYSSPGYGYSNYRGYCQ